MDIDKALVHAIQDGIREGVKTKLSGYGSPLEVVIKDALTKADSTIRALLLDAIQEAVCEEAFRKEIKQAVKAQLAKILVQRFGGELEKQVNALKADPATRARITLAIEEIING